MDNIEILGNDDVFLSVYSHPGCVLTLRSRGDVGSEFETRSGAGTS